MGSHFDVDIKYKVNGSKSLQRLYLFNFFIQKMTIFYHRKIELTCKECNMSIDFQMYILL